METIKLNDLLHQFQIACGDQRIIQGISDDSREIKKDWLFVCYKGSSEQILEYMSDALEQGGIVLCECSIERENVYVCEHIEYLIDRMLTYVYGDVCHNLCVIGVTGTSGKTSVASLITQLLELQGHRVMQIGTGFMKDVLGEERTHNTTPGCFQLAMYFQRAHEQHIPYIVMEVSSHAIDQRRIRLIHFDMILYTNIKEDHLDYHLTKTHYRYTKFKLRQYLKPQGAIICNADMPYMQELIDLAQYQCLCFGTQEAHFPIRNIMLSDHDITFDIQSFHYQASLLGMMNVYNLCSAIVAMRRLGVSYECLQESVSSLKSIPGRMEIIHTFGYQVWIDYAHTSDALENLLSFAQQVVQGKLICIIGCGGDRDKSKRPIMADITAKYSDIAIFTSDNPRYESVAEILRDMQQHIHENVHVFENRFYAMKHAVKIAQKSDIIVIAGKGNEDTITICGEEYPFSDRNIIKKLFCKEELEWR